MKGGTKEEIYEKMKKWFFSKIEGGKFLPWSPFEIFRTKIFLGGGNTLPAPTPCETLIIAIIRLHIDLILYININKNI
jgi:hypothetical protein